MVVHSSGVTKLNSLTCEVAIILGQGWYREHSYILKQLTSTTGRVTRILCMQGQYMLWTLLRLHADYMYVLAAELTLLKPACI